MVSIILGITGASGVIYGVRLLEVLKDLRIESHLIVTKAAEKVLAQETEYSPDYIKSLATYVYDVQEIDAPVASGSFKTEGMAIVPCSMKTLAAISCGYSSNLLLRAADVCLKEKRKLVLVPREAPLNTIHLENMLKLSRLGVCILPASPPFYNKPKTLDDIVNHIVGRVLDMFDVHHNLYRSWGTEGKIRHKEV